ncbi:MAG: hypothetical protein B7Z06_02830 [Flavobacteriales bacterium 32-35-8]|nr:MAG: hypothetical protein B7Z06_02830 [Flavobacteriales bacterium 32-35-8]
MKYIIFISSVQKEFAKERMLLANHIAQDPLLKDFFKPYLFETDSVSGDAPDNLYLANVKKATIYLALLGKEYGYQDATGISPTEREYDLATNLHKERWVFIAGDNQIERHPKMATLIEKIGLSVSRKRFYNSDELLAALKYACVSFLKQKGLIASQDFDNSVQAHATLNDINESAIKNFVRIAREKRGFPLRDTATTDEVLSHLNLLKDGKLVNSALLAFALKPQQFFHSATVKCAHFHGYVVEKPIPDFKEFGGTVFEMADQATDFVLSKISQRTGDRSLSNSVDTSYEIPRIVIAEAIINAVAHRDYTSKASIQVAVFKDRVEIFNPGTLPATLTIDKLKTAHGSYPHNPLLATCLYNTGNIERYGTGTKDIFTKTNEAGLREPIIKLDEGFKVI